MVRTMMAAALVALLGCGEGDDTAEKMQAQQRCETFKSTLCARAAECGGGTVAECRQELATVIDCGKAVATTPAYDRCVKEIAEFTCSVLFPASGDGMGPASCQGAIQVTE